MIELSTFCEKSGLVDETMKLANIDLLYVSTYAKTKGNIKNKNGLIRCEFLEILVRIAKFKFLETGKCSSFKDATTKLIEEYVKPNNNTLFPWQDFRDKELWTLEINDVLHANLSGL
eukprot:CAMPEP_0116885694 /NCGR_PEP_ID=MMETSP0463-20121206/19214_1 /TAXON_ID=181622 /ORGANISM="Strombidinopsis sp, Strain SopsisLIS2011" /LENGTH=116 /DNA_ID=CAMNT_0004544711 /DNA_START=480 /DNA_END=830 /DNA_ORIENTATION=+